MYLCTFQPEILQAGAVKGLIYRHSEREKYWLCKFLYPQHRERKKTGRDRQKQSQTDREKLDLKLSVEVE